jgi:hypothetical protein
MIELIAEHIYISGLRIFILYTDVQLQAWRITSAVFKYCSRNFDEKDPLASTYLEQSASSDMSNFLTNKLQYLVLGIFCLFVLYSD